MSNDERFMRAMPFIALVLVGALYLGEWAYHATRDALPLRMSGEMRK